MFLKIIQFCKLQTPGLKNIIPGQENMVHSLFTKSNDEVLTICLTCA